jgi:hypothetical protein
MKKNRFELIPENIDYISGAMSVMTGASFTPRVDTENSLIQYHYAMDNEDYVNKNVEGPLHKSMILKSILDDSGKDFREYAISKKLGLISNLEQNGVDAYKVEFDKKGTCKLGNTYELKSERLRSNKKTKSGFKKLSGCFGISNMSIKNKATVDEWIDKNDKIVISGWVRGKIAYIVSFSTKKSKVREHIIQRLNNNAKVSNGGITFSYNHFVDADDFYVEYINKKLCTAEYVSDGLLEKIFGAKKTKRYLKRPVKLNKDMLKKYSKEVKLIKSGLIVRQIVDKTGTSTSTIGRLKKQLKILENSK